MKYLTRKEELLLLAVVSLGETASLVSIRDFLGRSTGETWTIGNVYVALDKMVKAGRLEGRIGEPSARRGGKAVRYYRLSDKGRLDLERAKKVQDRMWRAFNAVASSKRAAP